MAKITNRFVHFKTKASFTSRLGAGDIQESSVVFIQDANEIWTHGTYYKCNISRAEVEALITSKGYITEEDIPSLTGGAAATSGQYVSGVTVSGHTVTVTKAALPTTATKLSSARTFALTGAVTGSTSSDLTSGVSITTTLSNVDASKITSGTLNADRLPEIPISKIPAAALERLYVVDSKSAAVALKIQEGDVVQIGSGGPMYFCISESASTFATKFKVFTAGAATSVPWSGVTGAPTKLSQFTNDSGFITSVPAQTWGSITGKPSTFTPSAHTQAYTTLTGSTTTANQAIVSSGTANGWTLKTLGSLAFSSATVPTKTSQLTNDSGFLTSVPAQSWSSITGKPTFATVATSGSYNDLTNKPTIPSAYTLPTASASTLGGVKIGSGISISSGVISATYSSIGAAAASHTHTASQVTGLATVATSGSYNDLTNKPTIPSLSGYATQSWVTSQGYLTSIPAATSNAYGGIQIGYTTSGKNYAVELSNGKAYVNVPWTSYSIANASTAGLVKPINVITKPSINSITTTSGRYYSVQMSSDGNMFVNVPWVQGSSNPGTVTSITAGAGLTGGTITSSGTIKAKLRTEGLMSLDSINASSTSNRVYAVQQDKSGYLAVSVPWTDTNTDTKVTSVANHYTPSGGTTLSASGGSSLTAGSSQVVTGITKDAAGHVTGITSGSLPAAPTLSGLGGIRTVSASGTAPLTLSASKSGTSVTITGSVAAASSSSSGVVSTGTQTFAGEKTFSSEIQATGGISSKNIIHIDDGTYTGYLGNLDRIGFGSGDSFAVVSEGKLTLMTVDDSPIYFGQNEDCNITGSHFSGSAETANKVVGSLTIDGTAYNGSSNVTVNTKLLQGNNARSIIKAGYSYSGCNSSITSISGFSYNNPDAVVASSTKITSFPSNVRKMANIANLSGTYYVYCFSYIGGYVYVNGAVYA